MSSSPTAIDEYLNYQTEAEKKYGENTIVFYENGTFYEIYGVDNTTEKVGQPKRISELLNIAITRKNKKILENSRKNPLMVGVPTAHSEKYIKALIQNGMTIVFVEQITKPPNPERALTRVISPSTYISDDTKNDNNYVLAIYLEIVKNREGQPNLGCGLCAIDITVGDVIYYQMESHNGDFKIVFEEIFRFMESLTPKEIIFNLENCCIPFKEIQDYLEIYRYPYYIRELAKDYYKLGYQNSILKKTFEIESPISAIEYLNLESQLFSILAIMLSIDFIQEHDERILRHLHMPKEWEEKKHLILNNNTLYQLNIVRDGLTTGNIRSLFDIMNQTKTIIGKRMLKNWLMNPIVNAAILSKKYDILERIIGQKLWDKYDGSLEFVIDLERFFRKMSIGYLMPHEMSAFEPTLDAMKRMIEMAENDFVEEDNNWCDIFRISEIVKERFLEFYENYYKTFNVQLMGTFCLNDINQSFFNMGMIPELDEIQKLIGEQRKYFEKEAEKLSLLIDGKSTDAVKFDHNERDGYFLRTTSKRGEILGKKLGKEYTTRLTGANICRVSSEKLDMANLILQDAEFDIQTKVKDYFIKWCESQYMMYHESLCEIIRFISTIDMSICLGKISLNNNYKRPIIEEREEQDAKDGGSYVQFEGLRHPIIEKINQDILYVPNDITIQREGILLYGLNGGGKSSLLKAVGLAVVMAQMGCFVPAEKMVYYPFKTLYTRILGNDNIFRGLSSFALEMTELRSILRDSNKNSLILGDEICRGTEIYSALSIVSSAVALLCKRRTNFLFATHLHKLHEIDIIQEAKNLRHFYIDLQFSDGKIVFGRKIFEGIGEKLYGIEVAEYIIDNEEFQRLATKTRRQLLEESNGSSIGAPKSSNYNSSMYVDECAICGKKGGQLDVHHIHSQKYADCNDTIEYFNKNHGGNLVVLCIDHHNNVHKGEIIVHGWIETSQGKKLNWEKSSGRKVHIQGVAGSGSSGSGADTPITDELRAKILSHQHLLKNISLKIFKAKMEKEYKVSLTTQQIKDLIINIASS
jgi:DNA mismatch repair protein MutS